MPNVTCDLCGGNEFYKDSGLYYCKDCQTQTQNLQEHLFEQPDEYINTQRTKAVVEKKNGNETSGERLTSWECYNYILLGLVNELTELGASENLKSTIEVIWFKYLKGIDVIGKPDAPPKLPAFNSLVDAEIIYNRRIPKKKIRRPQKDTPTTNADISTLDELALRQERIKQKKALAKAKYTENLTITQQSTADLMNRSLGTLKGSSEGIKDPTNFLQYQRTASKELKRKMTKNHFREHCRDVNSILTCHKPSERSVSWAYVKSPLVLSRNKIFSLIYLGLLINKESIQLGDMLRFSREGHLSYEHCNHFFPEEIVEKNLNICTFNQGNTPLLSAGIRNCCAKMAKFLNMNLYIPVQNLCELTRRYCEELNLPDQIHKFVLTLLSKSEPKLSVYASPNSIPNYEARAICFIIFVLKLLFCLDDATEFEMSKLANALNRTVKNRTETAFNFELWLKHIGYRKLVLTEHHFPTKYLKDDYGSPENFIDFMKAYNDRNQTDNEDSVEIQLLRDLLDRIKNTTDCDPVKNISKNSLTPFRDYTKDLLDSTELDRRKYLIDLLSMDCTAMSLDFLENMHSYKEMLLPGKEVLYKHGGKNDEITITNLYNLHLENRARARIEGKLVNVTFAKSSKKTKIVSYDKPPPKRIKSDSKTILEHFEDNNKQTYKQNMVKNARNQANYVSNIKLKKLGDVEIDNYVYNPSERFWLNLQDISDFKDDQVKTYFEDLPTSFTLLLKECSRIIEQTEKELYMEYCIVEAYLCFVLNVQTGKFCDEKFVNEHLNKLLSKARKVW